MAAKKRSRRKKRSKAAVVLCIIALALLGSGAMLAHAYYEDNQKIANMRAVVDSEQFYEGISINGMNLAGMSKEAAIKELLAQDEAEIAKFTATIIVDGQEWHEVIPATANTAELIEDAYQLGRSGDLEVRYNAVTNLRENTVSYDTRYSSDPSRLRTLVDDIAAQVDVEPVNATVTGFDFDTKQFSYTDGSSGKKLNKDRLTREINDAITNEKYPIRIEGLMERVEPDVSVEELRAKNGLMASFQTETTKDSARNENIRLGSSALNKAVVQPGEEFSLNAITGERSPEKGYKEAGAYVGGRLVPEPGGGVCQVSTTLYNAAIRAGLEITERNSHSQTVSYVPKGEDAMINYPNRDLKFINSTDNPIYIISYFQDRQLKFEIYGTRILGEGEKIDLRSEVIEEIEPSGQVREADSTLLVGAETVKQKPKVGYRTLTHVELYRDGTVVEEIRSYKSYYAPVKEVVAYGTLAYGGSTSTPTVSAGDDGIPVIMP